jgi:hypothetical protein
MKRFIALEIDLCRASPSLQVNLSVPIKVLGHYSFTLADPILNGDHRPLNNQIELGLEGI